MVRAWDRTERLSIVPFSDRLAGPLLAGLPENRRWESAHVVDPSGTVASEGDAAAAVFRCLPGVRWLGRAATRSDRVRRSVHRGYHAVARRRGRLSRFVPDVKPAVRHPEP